VDGGSWALNREIPLKMLSEKKTLGLTGEEHQKGEKGAEGSG